MDHKAFVRGVLLTVPSSIGVVLGSILFMQKLRNIIALFTGIIISFSLVGLTRLTG